MKKNDIKNLIILIVTITIIVVVIIFGLKREKEVKVESGLTDIDISDVNNVDDVDAKLKLGDYRVTQSYLLNYTKKKSAVWYSSEAIVKKISKNGVTNKIVLYDKSDSKKTINAYIDNDINIKKNDKVYFVGTITISNGSINLAKISKDAIDYNSVTKISFSDLYDSIYYLKNTYVLVSGYMITNGPDYKLYSSKSNYKNDVENSDYFSIEWDGKFNYTGNQEVLLRCFIGDRYKLIGCSLEK